MFTIWLYLVVVDLNVCYDFCDSPKIQDVTAN